MLHVRDALPGATLVIGPERLDFQELVIGEGLE